MYTMGFYVYLPGSVTARITKADYLLVKSAFHGICRSFRNIGSSVMHFGILNRLLKIYPVKSCNVRSTIFTILQCIL